MRTQPTTVSAFRRWLTCEIRHIENQEDFRSNSEEQQFIAEVNAAESVEIAGRFAVRLQVATVLSDPANTLAPREALAFLGKLARECDRVLSQSPVLDIGQVAEMVKVAPRTIRRRFEDGQFPAPYRIGRLIRWHRADVEAVLLRTWTAGPDRDSRR